MKIALFLLLFTTLAFDRSISYWSVHNMPRGVEKDYYIWRLLQKPSTTKLQAKYIIKELSHINTKLQKAYRKKTGLRLKKNLIKAETTPEHIWKRRLKAKNYFYKGLELLRHGHNKQAVAFLRESKRLYTKRHQKDKVLFWLYMATKDRLYLSLLNDSYSPNIYRLLAADFTNEYYPLTYSPSFGGGSVIGFNPSDPIDWSKLKHKIYSGFGLDWLASRYATQETIGAYCYIKEKASNHKKPHFPLPYRREISRYSLKRQALIYALARQESRFIPSAVSRSFALGMMQFMPFLIKHIAAQRHERIDLDAIFDPKRAIVYANDHLNYLTKYLQHPLFIAYAYNAGIGFTKRYLKKGHPFRKGPFEPYMSMEMMRKNDEAREYGKKVLANYVIYLNKLGIPTRAKSLIDQLIYPRYTDKFRK